MSDPIENAAGEVVEAATDSVADLVVGHTTGYPPVGTVPEKRIALWGAPGSGRTTFLAMVEEAAEESCRRVEQGRNSEQHNPGWRVRAGDQATFELQEKARAMLSEPYAFPTWSPEPQEYRFLFRRRPRLRLLRGLADRTRFVAAVRELPTPTGSDYQAVQADLNTRTGLILLFDPTCEDVDWFDDLRRLLRGAIAYQQNRTKDVDRLPIELAVCISKIDHERVFSEARSGAWAELDRHGRVRVRDPEAFFHWLCDPRSKFGAGAAELPELLARYFARIRYYATSSAGFRSPEHKRIDPESCRNVTSDRKRCEGRPRPQGIVEPILEMRATSTAKEG
ncbi:hypothetical protein [Embleya scabrispora]|uniref:hypothetical protein n=1 Tax=Embleya scabrispora TaxID=159449 RepID=UPI00035FD6A9|nr:hypothetical protein [Embleya scabrispora]MYS83780.1 hypothetical protein [Streptomyces sp. SID5474]